MFDCDELISSELDVSVPTSLVHDSETVLNVLNVEPSTTKPTKTMSQSNRPSAPIIEDWVSDLEDESEGEAMPTQKEPSFVQTSEHVKTPRTSVKLAEHPIHAENLSKDIPKSRGVIDNGCSRHMTGNIFYLSEFEDINGGCVAFGGNPKGGKITSKGKIRTGKLDFDDVYFVKELKFNLFSVSQMCDKKNNVLFADTECVVLSSDFKLPGENHMLLRVPRENNVYNVDLKNIVPLGYLTCLFAKATLDESNLWHRRLGHINFKTMNKLVKSNLVRGLPSKVFESNHTCVACKKDKQHRASCKTKHVNSVSQPIQRVLVTKPHNKTPYELLLGKTPSIGFMRPFGCPVTIFNTLDPLEKFNGKADEGFLVRYFVNSKAFRVFNSITRIVQETLHINFLENHPNVVGSSHTWMFDIDTLTQSMNYHPIAAGNQPNSSADPQNRNVDAAFDDNENESTVHVSSSNSDKTKKQDEKAKREAKGKSPVEFTRVTAVGPGTGKSFNYDIIPESYDEVPNPPSQCHFNIYLCQICESNSHYGYECSQRVPLVYEPEPCYNQNFSDNYYSHDLPGVNPLIDHHCCYVCGNSLNDFFCYQCTCEFCGNDAHDSDSRMEEIDLTFTLDDPMPPSIEDDDNDSKRDILILQELPDNYSISLPVIESFYFDIPSFSRPPAKPPDGNTRILNIKIMGDISDQKVPMPRLAITRVSNQEKSPNLLSHRGLEIFKLSSTCPMMIHEKNIPILDVPLFYFYPP
nr:ribonuclease H-like domain-containing protein [Tanacetum cinerariifolium]